MKRNILVTVVSLFCALDIYAQGSLTPPGAPASTMRTLSQIEPRTPISSLPYDITLPGSYYLTGNLVSTSTVANGITIYTNDVTIDLGGFEMTGPSSGTVLGISNLGSWTNLVVRNGSVRSWPRDGINLSVSTGCLVENVTVSDTGAGGIDMGKSSVVRNSTATRNLNAGISATTGSSVLGCVAKDNKWAGISVGAGNTIDNCTVDGNAFSAQYGVVAGVGCTIKSSSVSRNSSGISTGSGSLIISCTVSTNAGTGVSLGDNSSILDSVVSSNVSYGVFGGNYCSARRCTVAYNTGDGINFAYASTVSDCTVGKNSGNGIKFGDGNHVFDNNCTFNGAVGVYATGTYNRIEANNSTDNVTKGFKLDFAPNVLVRNSAIGTNNYTIAVGNLSGPIVTSSTMGTNTNPNANFAY